MYDDEDEELIFPEDEFKMHDDIVMWAEQGIELGYLLGFSDHGVIWRRTHFKEKTGDGPKDWEFEPLQRSILTFTRWELIDRLESHAEITEEHEIGKFTELLADVNGAADFEAVVQTATEDAENED